MTDRWTDRQTWHVCYKCGCRQLAAQLEVYGISGYLMTIRFTTEQMAKHLICLERYSSPG